MNRGLILTIWLATLHCINISQNFRSRRICQGVVSLHESFGVFAGAAGADFPAVDPQIVFEDSEAACERVVAGTSELAVITLPRIDHPRLVTTPIWHDPLGIYVSPEHGLADGRALSVNELAQVPAVLPPVESHTYAILRDAFAARQATPQARMTSHSLETLAMLAGVGLGWTILPKAMPHGLYEPRVPDLVMSRTLGVVRHPQRHLSNAARALLGRIEVSYESAPSAP